MNVNKKHMKQNNQQQRKMQAWTACLKPFFLLTIKILESEWIN